MLWMRRSTAAVRNGANGAAARQQQTEQPFNPNNRRYRTCCCHCKTFTLGFAVVELFLICFVLVAIAPDFNSKICSSSPAGNNGTTVKTDDEQMPTTEMTSSPPPPLPITSEMSPAATFELQASRRRRRRQATIIEEQTQMPEVLALIAQKMSSSSPPTASTTTVAVGMPSLPEEDSDGFSTMRLLRTVTCTLTILWLAWAILQMCSVGLMCYGVKRQRWPLLIPHIFFRFCCAIAVWLVMAAFIGAFVHHPATNNSHSFNIPGHVALCVFLFLIFLWLALLLKSEIRCCEFVKRSAETGFSISNTRPIGPPTVSQSDSARGGDHMRRIVQSGMRKMPGPSAKRYQTKQQQTLEDQQRQGRQQQQQQQQEGSGNEMSTLSTLATTAGGGGLQTRPSTAGSLALSNGAPRAGSAGEHRDGQQQEGGPEVEEQEQNLQLETNFGGSSTRVARPGLPPLRHTHKMIHN